MPCIRYEDLQGHAEVTRVNLEDDLELTKGVCRVLQKAVDTNETSLLNQLLQLLDIDLEYLRDCQYEMQSDPQQPTSYNFICRIEIPFDDTHFTGYGQGNKPKSDQASVFDSGEAEGALETS